MVVADISAEKLPPQNVEAEMSVLGSMLIEEEAIATAVEILDDRCFYKEAHRYIFQAALTLYSANKAVDLVTLTEELKKRNLLDEVGGPSYLTLLATHVPTAANIEHYAHIVKEKAILRDLIRTSTHIAQEAYDSLSDPDTLLDKAESLIFDIANRRLRRGFIPMKDIIKDSIEMIDNIYQKKGLITGIPTGFVDLDRQTAGLQPSDLIIIAGRPSMGKSAFISSIAEHVAVTNKLPTAIFSLEMSKEHLVQRMLCSHARIDHHSVRSGTLPKSDWPKLTQAAGKLADAPIFIDDTPNISSLELRAKARRLKSHHDIKLIIMDYLQLMNEPSFSDNRQQEISVISRNLKALARELGIPIIAVSQLSRAPEKRETFRPRLSDLRESGAIEQDADVVILLFREEYYNPKDENKGIAEIIIGKQRNGPVGSVEVLFIKEYTRFENLSHRDGE